MAFSENSFISQFNIQPNGCINIQKTNEVLKDGEVISTSYWRTVLVPNDPEATTVLNEAYFLNIANYTWGQPSPQPYPIPKTEA